MLGTLHMSVAFFDAFIYLGDLSTSAHKNFIFFSVYSQYSITWICHNLSKQSSIFFYLLLQKIKKPSDSLSIFLAGVWNSTCRF